MLTVEPVRRFRFRVQANDVPDQTRGAIERCQDCRRTEQSGLAPGGDACGGTSNVSVTAALVVACWRRRSETGCLDSAKVGEEFQLHTGSHDLTRPALENGRYFGCFGAGARSFPPSRRIVVGFTVA